MAQTGITILSIVVSFIGGGAVGALLNWLRAEKSEKRTRKIRYLEDQLNKLYGPLYFIISQSDKLFEIEKKYQQAYKLEFTEKKYSKEKLTQERVEEDAHKTIELKNKYINLIKENNIKIKSILDNNFSYIDADDIDLTINYFYEHFARLEVETETKPPFMIYNHIGDISFLRPEFIDGIKKKFIEKKEVIETLSVK